MSQHNSLMQKRFRQIVDMKFKRRCHFYFKFWRFRIKEDHHCCVKYENSRHFFLIQVVFAKSFKNFRICFFRTMLTTFIRILIFLDVNTFNKAFLVSRNFFDNFDEFEQRKLFFRKEILFSLFNDWFFRENQIISLFEVSFRKKIFDDSTATKMLIDVDSNDDVSSNVDNWNSTDDEIFFFIIDFKTTFCRELFHTCFRINILSYCFSLLFSNICNAIARYVT
jgi:hypothetical protein